jgi:DNA repair ATPase RecN
MGRKALFTQHQVFETADTLTAQGKEVTATSLLAALGGGSLTTIYRHLIAWQEARPAASTPPAALEIPNQVQVAFASAWRMAAAEAAREVTAVREKSAEDVRAAQKQFQEALEQIERLEAESETDSVRIESLSSKLSELETMMHNLESDLAAEKARSGQLHDLVKSQESELERLRKERDNAANEAAELRGQAQTLKEQNKELFARLPEQKSK